MSMLRLPLCCRHARAYSSLTETKIHMDEERGDILVFLSGQEEIETLAKLLKEKSLLLPEGTDNVRECLFR